MLVSRRIADVEPPGYAITADVYAKVRPQLQRTAADAMQRLLGT
jgi:hypothetical protein